jgi:hypothetical protein
MRPTFEDTFPPLPLIDCWSFHPHCTRLILDFDHDWWRLIFSTREHTLLHCLLLKILSTTVAFLLFKIPSLPLRDSCFLLKILRSLWRYTHCVLWKIQFHYFPENKRSYRTPACTALSKSSRQRQACIDVHALGVPFLRFTVLSYGFLLCCFLVWIGLDWLFSWLLVTLRTNVLLLYAALLTDTFSLSRWIFRHVRAL